MVRHGDAQQFEHATTGPRADGSEVRMVVPVAHAFRPVPQQNIVHESNIIFRNVTDQVEQGEFPLHRIDELTDADLLGLGLSPRTLFDVVDECVGAPFPKLSGR